MTHDPNIGRLVREFLATHTLDDDAHLTLISYLLIEPPRPATQAASRSRAWAKDTYKAVLSIADYESAISDMLNRDLVWEIDAAKQALIRNFVNESPALGPTNGIPEIGTLQISVRFARLRAEFWAGVNCERPGADWCRDWQSEKFHLVYCRTRKSSFDFLQAELTDDETEIEYVCGPNECGPWRCSWWQRYESGYVIEVRYA